MRSATPEGAARGRPAARCSATSSPAPAPSRPSTCWWSSGTPASGDRAARRARPAGHRRWCRSEQHGTGHAVRVALEGLDGLEGTVVVVPGDAPLLTAATLSRLVAEHEAAGAATTLLTALLDDPTGYGRVVRGAGRPGRADRRAQGRDRARSARSARSRPACTRSRAGPLREALGRLSTDNAQGEEYLTDVVGLHRERGPAGCTRCVAGDPRETAGVNDRAQLAAGRPRPARPPRRRPTCGPASPCSTPRRPGSTPTSCSSRTARCCRGCSCTGARSCAAARSVGPDTTLTACEVGEDARVVRTHAEGAVDRPARRRSGRSATCGRAPGSAPAPRSARTSR